MKVRLVSPPIVEFESLRFILPMGAARVDGKEKCPASF
jgi:hypothetical protein